VNAIGTWRRIWSGGRGNATARDVYALMRLAQDVVYERTSVWLRPEIELLGLWTPEERAALSGNSVLSHG